MSRQVLRSISLIFMGYSLGCDDTRATVEPGEDATLDGAPGDARPSDAQPPVDAQPPDAADDLGIGRCQVSVSSPAGTFLGRCPVPDAPGNCVTLAECLCTFPTEPTGFESCVIAIAMPRAQPNLSDYCGSGQLSMGAVVREPGWRGTWDQGSYQLSAEPACDAITARP